MSTLYGSILTSGASLDASDASQLDGAIPGAYNIVVWDHTKRDGFRLVGPGFDHRTTALFVGRQVWRVKLRGRAVYRYGSTGHPKRLTSFRVGR